MFMILTTLVGGKKVRINVNKIIKYSTISSHVPDPDADRNLPCTEMVIEQSPIMRIKESVEEIDSILKTLYVTVHEKK